MRIKVTTWAIAKGSRNKKTAIINIQLGAMYCSNPKVDRYSRRAPRVKHSKGTAVSGAQPINIKSNFRLTLKIVP
jgi:hypothetical protein